jgi:uncharacterized membrane protein YvlD (DUF360 family)
MVLNQEFRRILYSLRDWIPIYFFQFGLFYPKINQNIFVLSKIFENCFIFVQTASSAVFIVRYAHRIRLFHTLFNKTVENFPHADRAALL